MPHDFVLTAFLQSRLDRAFKRANIDRFGQTIMSSARALERLQLLLHLERPRHHDDWHVRQQILQFGQKIQTQLLQDQSVLSDGDKSPIVQRHKKDLQAVDAELAALRKEIRPRLVTDLEAKAKMDQGANQARLQQRIAVLKNWETRLEKDVTRLRKEIEQIGTSTLGSNSPSNPAAAHISASAWPRALITPSSSPKISF